MARVDVQAYHTIVAASPEVALSIASLARQRIGGLQALFTYDAYGNPYKRAQISEDSPRFVHPIVIRHPKPGC